MAKLADLYTIWVYTEKCFRTGYNFNSNYNIHMNANVLTS